MTGDTAEAWADYWREMSAAGHGCVPQSPGIAAATRDLWVQFGRMLPKRAAVLDLATGNGVVLQHVQAGCPDARLVGIDYAPDLGGPVRRGLDLRAGVRMEELPFADGSFEAVTSQFGFEYGDTVRVAREVARLLRSGGRVRLLVHRSDSPIVRFSGLRGEALRWAIGPQSPLWQAESFAAARLLSSVPVPPALRAAPAQAAGMFPGQSAGQEVMAGMLQILDLGGASAPALLARLRAKASAELARIEALERAARDQAGIEAIAAELAGAGLVVREVDEVREPGNGPVFGWVLDGARG